MKKKRLVGKEAKKKGRLGGAEMLDDACVEETVPGAAFFGKKE